MIIKRDRIDSDYSDYKEEYAAEVAPQRIDYDYDDKDDKDVVKSSVAGSTAGFIALALSILSLFTFPTLFGLVSVLLGIYAYNRGATVTGGIAQLSVEFCTYRNFIPSSTYWSIVLPVLKKRYLA